MENSVEQAFPFGKEPVDIIASAISARICWAIAIAKRSGISLAILFGETSPKISTRMVMASVETLHVCIAQPAIKTTVAIEARPILIILLPIKIVESRSS